MSDALPREERREPRAAQPPGAARARELVRRAHHEDAREDADRLRHEERGEEGEGGEEERPHVLDPEEGAEEEAPEVDREVDDEEPLAKRRATAADRAKAPGEAATARPKIQSSAVDMEVAAAQAVARAVKAGSNAASCLADPLPSPDACPADSPVPVKLEFEHKEPERKANSSSHRAEWATFMRQVAGKDCPKSLGPSFKQDRIEVFNVWLKESKNLHTVAQVMMQRKIEQERSSETKVRGFKKRERERDGMPPEQVKMLIEARLKDGGFYEDPDFPGDPEEYYFYKHSGRVVARVDRTTDIMSLRGAGTVDEETAGQLTQEGGLFDRAPSAPGLHDGLVRAMMDGGKAGPRPKPKPKPKPTELLVVDYKTKALEHATEILREASEARSLGLRCGLHSFGQSLRTELIEHAVLLEKKYAELCKLGDGTTEGTMADVERIAEEVAARATWYKVRKESATSMTKQAKPGGKAKAKAKERVAGSAAEPSK